MSRYKGLLPKHRREALIACRPDTLVQGGGGFPAKQSNIGEPSNGQNTKIWTDAGYGGAFLSAEGDSIPYRASPGGLEMRRADEDELRAVPGVANSNLGYWSLLHSGSFTAAVRFRLDSIPPNDTSAFVLCTGDYGNGSPVWTIDIGHISGSLLIQSAINDGSGGTAMLAKRDNPPIESGQTYDLYVEVDGNDSEANMVVNGELWGADSGFSLLNGSIAPHTELRVNGGFPSPNTDRGDITVTGILIYPDTNVGPALIDWINGGDLTL